MSEQWYCKVVGQEVGPLTRDQLREMFNAGELSSEDSIRSIEHSAWQRLSRVFPELTKNSVERKTWYFHSFGDEFGPCSFKELQDYAEKGQLSPSDDVREGTSGPWKQARLVKDLFPHADDILSGFDTLDDAPEEAKPKPKPRKPKPRPVPPPDMGMASASEPSRGSATAAARSAPGAASSSVAAWAEATGPQEENPSPANSVAMAAPPMNGVPSAPPPDSPPAGFAAPSPPPARPSFTPPPPSRSSGGGGFELPEWLVDGKMITIAGIAAGLVLLLGGGWYLMGSGMFSSFAAGGVYQDTVALYGEFKTASQDGPDSPAFTSFYQNFKTKQYELFQAIGSPSPDSAAFEVKKALQYLGSVVESFRRESTTEAAQKTYVEALENQLKKLEPEFGA